MFVWERNTKPCTVIKWRTCMYSVTLRESAHKGQGLQTCVFHCIYLCIHHSLCDFSHLWQDGQGVWQSILCSRLRFVTTELTLEEEVIESKRWHFITHKDFLSLKRLCTDLFQSGQLSYALKLNAYVINGHSFYIWVETTQHTRSCISFCSRTKAFRVPTANTYVSMSSSFMVTFICFKKQQQNSPVRFCDGQSSKIAPKIPTPWCIHPPLECEYDGISFPWLHCVM